MDALDSNKMREEKLSLYNQILVELGSNAVFKSCDFLAVARLINQKICDVLSASKVSIWKYYDTKMILENIDTYNSKKTEHFVQKPFLIGDYPHYFEVLKNKRSIAIPDISVAPFFSGVCQERDVDSFCAILICPIRHEGDFAGVFVIEHSDRPHIWDTEEKFFASAVADLITIIHASTERNITEQKLSSLITHLPGIAFRGRNDAPDFTMEFVSNGCLEILGYPPEAILNNQVLSIRDILHPDDIPRLVEEAEKTLSKGLSLDINYRIIHKNGSVRWIWSRSRIIEMDPENPANNIVEGFLSDITAIKELEALEQTSLAKSDFIASISHEIRTPLNAIISLADRMIASKSHKPNILHAQNIKNSSHSLLNLLNGMIEFSKLEAHSMELDPREYDIAAFIKDISGITNMVLNEKNVHMLVDIDPTLPSILKGDDSKLRQILLNLLSNASKFTEAGFVKLKIMLLEKQGDNALIRFSIEDTGRGISEDNIGRIFKVFGDFDTRKNRLLEGSGLGLHIVKKLVELMGGKIELKSIFGQGSEFSFNLNQQIVNQTPVVNLSEEIDASLLILTNDNILKEHLEKLTDILSVKTLFTSSMENIWLEGFSHILIDVISCPQSISFAKDEPKISRILLNNVGNDISCINEQDNVIFPPIMLTTLADILRNDAYSNRPVYCMIAEKSFTTCDTRVLIVDDNDINLEVASCLLEQYNITTDRCLSGKEALDAVEINSYDIIFMDQMMPEMDGEETAIKIREKGGKYQSQIIIALTANVSAKERLLAAGLNDFMTKPLEIPDMENVLRKWLPPEKIVYAKENG